MQTSRNLSQKVPVRTRDAPGSVILLGDWYLFRGLLVEVIEMTQQLGANHKLIICEMINTITYHLSRSAYTVFSSTGSSI